MKKISMPLKKTGKSKGVALITVLLLTSLLLIMMVSLISITSHTLYRTTADVERSSIVPLAEAAINEALMHLNKDSTWGASGTDTLVFKLNQDPTIGGFNKISFITNSAISYENRGFFYITFDNNDSAFPPTGKKYYSVNYLDKSNAPTKTTKSWRGKEVMPGTASIVVTVVFGSTVKHIEAIVAKSLSDTNMTCGSRGTVKIGVDTFMLQTENGTPAFHSNSKDANAVVIGETGNECKNIAIVSGGSVSAQGKIDVNGKLVDDVEPYDIEASEKTVPVLKSTDLTSAIPFSKTTIPSGVYVNNGGTLYYNADDDSDPEDPDMTSTWSEYNNNVPGFTFKDKEDKEGNKIKTLTLSDNLKVNYNSADPNATGNLAIYNTVVDLGESSDKKGLVGGYTIYTEGDGTTRDPKDLNNYATGNLTIALTDTVANDKSNKIDNLLLGQGNIYAEGGITLKGNSISGGTSSQNVALFSNGDINVTSYEDTVFYGLLYTYGDLNVTMDNKKARSDFDTKRIDKHGGGRGGHGGWGKDGSYKGPGDGDNYKGQSNNIEGYGSGNGSFVVKGSIIVAGKDPNTDPTGNSYDPGELSVVNATGTTGGTMDIIYDQTILRMLSYNGGVSSGFTILSWHEF